IVVRAVVDGHGIAGGHAQTGAGQQQPGQKFRREHQGAILSKLVLFIHMTREPRIPCEPDSSPAYTDKAAWRRPLLAMRRALDQDQKVRFDRAIGQQVLSWWERERVDTLGVYWPLSGEPDLAEIYAELATRGVRLALPLVIERGRALAFVDW